MVAPVVAAGAKIAVKQGVKIAAKQAAKAAAKQAAKKGAKVAAAQVAKKGAKTAAKKIVKKGATRAASRTAYSVLYDATPTFSRLLQNPAAAKRFLKTKAGKTAMFNLGMDLVRTKDAKNAINQIFKQTPQTKRQEDLIKQYESIQQRIDELQKQIKGNNKTTHDVKEMSAKMQRLLRDLMDILQKLKQSQVLSMGGVQSSRQVA